MIKNECITDERLDGLLDSMRVKDETEIESLRPPVINEYRLETEHRRRQKSVNIALAVLASVISTTVMIFSTVMLLKIRFAEVNAFLDDLHQTDIYKMLVSYSSEIKTSFIILAVIMLICYILGTTLLVKNRDRILQAVSK